VARLFGPSIFEASKLKVLFLGVDEKKHPGKLPRTYTLTHSDITSKLTLAISQTINNSQVLVVFGVLSLDWVLKAFVHGDGNLLNNYPELQEALVWVYFHSTIPEFNKVECWGPLVDAEAPPPPASKRKKFGNGGSKVGPEEEEERELPKPCQEDCSCCFPPISTIPWSQNFPFASQTHQPSAGTATKEGGLNQPFQQQP
ncbi:Protein STAY-GREEN 1, chloroplastic, partial [Linum perenne]